MRQVSPAVFTKENEVKFLPQGIAEIGAAFVGPTERGPAFRPTIVESKLEFESTFGVTSDDSYTPFAVNEYLTSSGRATVVRVLGLDGYSNLTAKSVLISLSGSEGKIPLAVVHPSIVGVNIASSSVSGTGTNFSLQLSGSTGLATYASLSADLASTNYIANVLGSDAKSQKVGYVYAEFPRAFTSFAASGSTTLVVESLTNRLHLSGSAFGAYSNATTPVIQSQPIAGTKHSLFTVSTFGDGNAANAEVKVSITNIKAASVAGDYGTFSLSVRKFADTDGKQEILEQYDNLTLDPESTDYVARRIGDTKISFDARDEPYLDGEFPAQSKYVYVTMEAGITSVPVVALPWGFAPLRPSVQLTTLPAPTYVTSSYSTAAGASTAVKGKSFYGFHFTDRTNLSYLKALPSGSADLTVANDSGFSLDDLAAADAADITAATSLAAAASLRKFSVPFQGGFDGLNPAAEKAMGASITSTNTQGFDLSDSAKSGARAYSRAVNSIANPDAYDINMIATPGVIHSKHSYITAKVIDICEARGDCFYIMDADGLDATVATAISAVEDLDTNYAAVYHPWIKVNNSANGKLMWVPPSTVMPAIFAFNDRVAAEWFAPAGLNRGGISSAIQVKSRLSHQDRDDLYEARVNPIATFPAQGIVAFGQKTLQATPGALDRINVRRLMIAVKKFIASSSRYLVFEQNVDSTRQKFLNIVNPYLTSVQERSGLYAFKVVMDETNNTPDLVDRNVLVGEIWLKPAKSAEFISLTFSILPSGANFSDA